MASVSIGDRVSDLAGTHDGKLVEIDGDTGYVLQANGVEVEFPLARLKPYEAPKVTQVRTLSGALRDTALSPQQKALLAAVPTEILAAVARSYEAGAEAPDRDATRTRTEFAALPDQKRLEVIRIYLPSLPQRLLMQHTKLVVAMRDMGKASR